MDEVDPRIRRDVDERHHGHLRRGLDEVVDRAHILRLSRLLLGVVAGQPDTHDDRHGDQGDDDERPTKDASDDRVVGVGQLFLGGLFRVPLVAHGHSAPVALPASSEGRSSP